MKLSSLNYRNIEELIAYIKIDLLDAQTSVFKNAYIITATTAMSKAIENENLLPGNRLRSINPLLSSLLPSWYDGQAILEQFLHLGEIIQELSNTLILQKHQTLALALKKNRNEVAKSIRLLLEADIMPNVLIAKTDEEKVFKEVYTQFVEINPAVKEFLLNTKAWYNPRVFKAMLRLCGLNIDTNSTLFFQGFYYITPLQERLLKAMQNAGFKIFYLNNYDGNVKEAYKIWEHNGIFKGVKFDKIENMGVKPTYFSEIFTGKLDKILQRPPVTITECKDIYSLVCNIGAHGLSNTCIFSPATDDIQDLLETFFPETTKKGQLLSYPVGQYLMSLYKMWNVEKQDVILDVENVRFALSTGWAGVTGDYVATDLDYFDKIASYFIGCQTLEEWQARANLLTEVNEKIVPLFGDFAHEKSRWESILGNPLLPYAAFNGDKIALQHVLQMVTNICEDCKVIFANRDKVDISKHFKNIFEIISQKASKRKVSKDEGIIARETLTRLSQDYTDVQTCTCDNLAEAMTYFLRGSLDELKDSAGLGREFGGPVYDLQSLEAVTYGERGKQFYLCFCDDRKMPGAERKLPWPLNEEFLDRTKKANSSNYHYIENYLGIIKYNALISRYLFYRAMQVHNLNVSWVTEYDGKVLSPSPYVRILMDEKLYDVKKTVFVDRVMHFSGKEQNKIHLEKDTYDAYKVVDGPTEAQPAEIIFNQKACSEGNLRNIYDFGLEKYPSFRSEFQVKFYTGNLLKIMKNNAVTRKGDAQEAAKELFAIMPMFNKIHQREILSDAENFNLRSLNSINSKYNGLEYPADRMYLKYLRGDVLNKCYNGDGELPDNFDGCVYCPHANRCIGRFRGEDNAE